MEGLMKIAMVVSPYELCPPEKYGGLERVCAWWAKEFIRQGHHVDLFAREGSTGGSRVFGWPYYGKDFEFALWAFGKIDPETDVVMDNTHEKWLADICEFPYVGALHMTSCRTDRNLVGCSKTNARLNNTPYHNYLGCDLEEYHFQPKKKDYVLFIGALANHKQVHLVIEGAREAKVPVRIGGALRPGYESYGHQVIAQTEKGEYLGEIGGVKKHHILEDAKALIYPVDYKVWQEPGATVVFEALACGTPVIASPSGCLPEIVEEGVNGFIVEPELQAIAKAIKKLDRIDPHNCRRIMEEKYSLPIIGAKWLEYFRRAIDGEEW